MPTRQGNISGSVATVAFDLPVKIVSFFLTNRTTGTITVNVFIVTDTGERAAVPLNLFQISGSIYTSDNPIILLAGYYLIIVASGSLDYYFSMEDL